MPIHLDSTKKHQLPRHLGILGTTGGGKSNTVARLVGGMQRSGASVVLLDVEGEYVDLESQRARRRFAHCSNGAASIPAGVEGFHVIHPVGRETARDAGDATPFSLRFEDLSPYAVMNLLDLNDAQESRFLKAYDVLKVAMKTLGIFPRTNDDADRDRLAELDEFDGGYPRMTLAMLRDVVNVCCDRADNDGKKGEDTSARRPLFSRELKRHEDTVRQAAATARPPGHYASWMALVGKLNRIVRLKIFDNANATSIHETPFTELGRVTVVDLSDTDSPIVNNLVIANLLRQVQRQQEADTGRVPRGERISPTVVIIEEAHEFLSATRLAKQPHLFEQVARIAKRGRKRWLSLCFRHAVAATPARRSARPD